MLLRFQHVKEERELHLGKGSVSPFRECWEMLVPKFTPFPIHILSKCLTFERIQMFPAFSGSLNPF